MENKFKKIRIMVILSTILIILGLILVVVPIFLKFFLFTQICFIELGNLILTISGSIGGFFLVLGIVLIIISLVTLKNDGTLYEKYKLGTNVNKLNHNNNVETASNNEHNQNIDINVVPPPMNVASLPKESTSTNIGDNVFENIPVIDTNTHVTQTVDYISPTEMSNITVPNIDMTPNVVEHVENEVEINEPMINDENNDMSDVSEINTITSIKKSLGKPKSKMFEHDNNVNN